MSLRVVVRLAVIGLAAAVVTGTSAARAQDPARAIHQAQIEARVAVPPVAVTGSDGRRHLAYELHLTNFDSNIAPLTLERVEVFADGGPRKLLDIDGARLGTLLAHPAGGVGGIPIEPGKRLTLFLWLTLPNGVLPGTLRHQLTFRTGDGKIQRAGGISTVTDRRAPIVIGPPLRGGRWLATDGPGNPRSHHWGSLVAVDGKLTIPQRYAIDWFGLDARDHSLRRQVASLAASTDADWVGYDSDVLAVADGVVRDVGNNAPDGTPLAPLAGPDDLTARTLYGNFVVLEIRPGVFVHYAHLRRGSVTVEIGERIRRGAVIGRLGQSGAAGAPHLHFQVSDRITFEESEGLPFVIDGFSLIGKNTVEATFDTDAPAPPARGPARALRNSMPLDGDVVRFR